MTDPRHEYERRTQRLCAALDALGRRSARISAGRGISFTLAAVLGVAGVWDARWQWWLALPFVALFVALVAWHEEVRRQQARVRRALVHYEDGLRRLDGTWPGHGVDGLAWRREHHPYDEDLDVLGPGSLFQLLCRARTPMGQGRLASWLLAPSGPEEAGARRDAACGLAGALDEREALAVLGPEGSILVDEEALTRWAARPSSSRLRPWQAVAALVTAGLIVTLLGWGLAGWGHRPVVVAAFVALLFGRIMASPVRQGLTAVAPRSHDLTTLAELARHMEASVGHVPRAGDVLPSWSGRPSRELGTLGRLLDAVEWARNPFFAPLAFVLQWHIQLALAIEGWRRRHGPQVRAWLEAVAAFEALHSIASHVFEHPDDVFPEWVDGPPRVEARSMAHPLLPAALSVRNDLILGRRASLYLVSGSNMSGKSTLLRALGSNVVLAHAGAPVRAAHLTLTPLTVAASIRVQDSLLRGASRFQAELARLRTVLACSEGERPLLFLLDEIFHGTHSHDRRIGAEAFLARLLFRGAIGLVTTHDLALTRIAQAHEGIVNVHFEDHVENGKMCFDYRLRDGVVERSNALALMEAEGLIEPGETGDSGSDTTT